jgi:hypothetical protein
MDIRRPINESGSVDVVLLYSHGNIRLFEETPDVTIVLQSRLRGTACWGRLPAKPN